MTILFIIVSSQEMVENPVFWEVGKKWRSLEADANTKENKLGLRLKMFRSVLGVTYKGTESCLGSNYFQLPLKSQC